MAYHDDLLKQALLLVHNEPKNPKQASLRRSVSTAYYGLFHFLIQEIVANWSKLSSRPKLARAFDHKTMKAAANRVCNGREFPFVGENPNVVSSLRMVAQTFVRLQDKRHIADYDNSTSWTRTQAVREVNAAEQAFRIWKSIRNEQIAQDFLVSIFVKHRD